MRRALLRTTAAILAALALMSAACTGATPTAAPAPTEPPPTQPPPTTAAPPTQPPPTEAPTDTPEPEPTAVPTEAPAPELPETPVRAVLGADPRQGSKFIIATGQFVEFEASELPVAPGTVEAHWYIAGDRYLVAYVGVDLEATGPLCPGNSIRTPQAFEHVSNAPTAEGACEGFTTLTDDPEVGPRVCHGILLYVTAIPSDAQGVLFGTINKLTEDGSAIMGLTSTAPTAAGMPEVEVEGFCG
jgi:hypothetical protein